MEKIPTLFKRDKSNPKRVTSEVTSGCEWVLAGEGTPTRKFDGACCAILDDRLFVKRREIKIDAPKPVNFLQCDQTDTKLIGWVPVDDSKNDQWFREGYENCKSRIVGTYELVGPKVQGNPEGYDKHTLIPHGVHILHLPVECSFEGLKEFLSSDDFTYEGIVWQHPDGRRAKIKKKDFV